MKSSTFLFVSFLTFIIWTLPAFAMGSHGSLTLASAPSVVLIKSTLVAPPTANAGRDQTIYLTKGSTVTLDGSKSSGDTYLWTEVSTDYTSQGNIVSPTSAITQVTGLPQGTFYFQLAATRGDTTARDIVVVKVDYDLPPANSTLIRELPLTDQDFINHINIRDDDTKYWSPSKDPHWNRIHTSYARADPVTGDVTQIVIDRGHLSNMKIDDEKGKLYATVQDGWPWAEPTAKPPLYARTELSFGSSLKLDSNKTYVFEWKGYFPKPLNFMSDGDVLTIFQVHPLGPTGTLFQYSISSKGKLQVMDNVDGTWKNAKYAFIGKLSDFYNQTHTIRTTIKEGKGGPGQTAFIKVEVDGVPKYYRDTGIVGTGLQTDYIKFGGIYDFNNVLVSGDINMRSRGKEATIVTEEFRVYTICSTAKLDTSPPTTAADSKATPGPKPSK